MFQPYNSNESHDWTVLVKCSNEFCEFRCWFRLLGTVYDVINAHCKQIYIRCDRSDRVTLHRMAKIRKNRKKSFPSKMNGLQYVCFCLCLYCAVIPWRAKCNNNFASLSFNSCKQCSNPVWHHNFFVIPAITFIRFHFYCTEFIYIEID